MNSCTFEHKTEYLMIVEVESLVKSLSYEANLVLSYAAIQIMLDLEDLLVANYILSRFARNQLPCSI